MKKKKVIHIHEEYPEHDWVREEDGSIDMWVLDSGYHNGPACLRCHESFCQFCTPDWEQEGPCVVDKYRCPSCGHPLGSGNYCSNCGQALDWSED